MPLREDHGPNAIEMNEGGPQSENEVDSVTVSALRPRGAKGTAYTVELSNGERLVLRADTVAARGLHVGDTFAAATLGDWQRDDSNRLAVETGLNLISYRPRSAKEVSDHLRRKSFAEAARDHAIHRLQELGYLDDAEFARFWVESRMAHRPRGKRALAWELREKGIADAIIEDALARIASDETAVARAAAHKRAATIATADYDTFRRKLGTFLARRGFSYEVVEQVVEDLWKEREAG